MEIAEVPTSYAVESFISSCVELSDLCGDGLDLSDLGQYSCALCDMFVKNGDLSTGIKKLLHTDEIFVGYFSTKILQSGEDYWAGIEGLITDIFRAICDFFKRLVANLWDFIKKIFSLRKNIFSSNENNLKKLKPLFDKHQNNLGKIPANSAIPAYSTFKNTLDKLNEVIVSLNRVDLRRLDTQLTQLIAKDDVDVELLDVDYESILGKSYIEDLQAIGIAFDNELPVFESVFAKVSTSSTVGELGYSYESLTDLHRIGSRVIDPLKIQMEKLTKILGNVSSSLARLNNKLTPDQKSSDKYKTLLETMPPKITRLISLYQKIGVAIVTYESKIADVIRLMYSDMYKFHS